MKGKKFPLDPRKQKVSDENIKSDLISVLVELWLGKTGMESQKMMTVPEPFPIEF